MKFRFLFLFLFFIPFLGFARPKAEKDRDLKTLEDSLKKMCPAIFKGKDADKLAANKKFIALFTKALNTEGAFFYPFDSLKLIANLRAPDDAFRIFNWDIPRDDGTYTYYGFVFVDDSKTGNGKKAVKNHFSIYELEDKSNDIKGPETATLYCDKWFGALYYQIIMTNDKDKKFYTILGWDGNNTLTWKKIIDAITFGKDGKPIFGEKNLFQKGRTSSKRIIFEYRGEWVMTLHWDEDKKLIVYDHLAPEVSGGEGMYQFYSSDGSYDAYEWKKGMWKKIEDYKAENPKDKTDGQYIPPTGDQNPSGSNNSITDPNAHKKKKLFHRKPKKQPDPTGHYQ
jgi:hypothetical protein